MNIVNNLEQTAKYYPDKTAIIFEDLSITYAHLSQKVNQLASGLEQMGIKKGDRLALFSCPISPSS